ncbi:cyclic nucleotide-binding domain-containing protein [Actinoplanes sp. NEAU-A12]|uniref:Cyclic nucleotide-binding domain-containing protein n=1 Tax=Actinoplanes sandaracinus TaxID=3045177 RepID=A0ABT6WG63_9ACTN|nr:cyclic nucleotide-binding domain-containing protein [Actinoplanes sandaracinus]MDI6098714.1 cyclic nucleotide-binding domain-containing protein [Actinoplanes sandaracinus]
MSTLSVFDLLAMHPLVADLPAGWLHRLAPHARPVHLVTGHRLFHEDGPADRFWLVHSGAVALDLHVPGRGDVVIDRLGAGAMVGWSWLLAPHRWRFGAVVAEDVRALELDAARVRAVLAADIDLGRQLDARFLAVAADRLQAARHRLVELYACPGGA